MNNFKILIQGPIHKNGLNYIRHYRQYCDTIISTWDGDNDAISQYTNVSMQPFTPNCYNRGNIYFQTLTMLNGLNLIDSEYVIKLRFDEYFTNLKPIFDAVVRNPYKLTCSNIMLNKSYPLTMSDHIIAGKTEFLRKMFTKVKKLCEALPPSETLPPPELLGLEGCKPITEVVFFSAFLDVHCIYPNPKKTIELWRNNLYIVDIGELGNFEVRCNTNNKILNRVKSVVAHSDGIRSIEDLCAGIQVV